MFVHGHVFNRQSFLFLLDLEIKKAQRYQNYLSLLSFTFDHLHPPLKDNPSISLKTVGNLLKDELRETDVIGQSGTNRLLVMLPYADMTGAHQVRRRLEKILHDFGFSTRGFAIEVGEVCFPTHATNIDDLLRMAGNHLS
ncbi:MAG: GGDEF domain-containing protein [Candidatus Hodarchaeota archaeon]